MSLSQIYKSLCGGRERERDKKKERGVPQQRDDDEVESTYV